MLVCVPVDAGVLAALLRGRSRLRVGVVGLLTTSAGRNHNCETQCGEYGSYPAFTLRGGSSAQAREVHGVRRGSHGVLRKGHRKRGARSFGTVVAMGTSDAAHGFLIGLGFGVWWRCAVSRRARRQWHRTGDTARCAGRTVGRGRIDPVDATEIGRGVPPPVGPGEVDQAARRGQLIAPGRTDSCRELAQDWLSSPAASFRMLRLRP